jgi:hypothetical protein
MQNSRKLVPRYDPSSGSYQKIEDLEFSGCELDRLSPIPHLPSRGIYANLRNFRSCIFAVGDMTSASQDCPNSCKQFLGTKGFRQVIIRTGIQPRYAVPLLDASRQHDHRDHGTPTQLAEHFKAVKDRHHHVQEHESEVAFESQS